MKSKVSKRKAFYIALATLVAVIIWIYVDMTGSPDGTALVMTKEFKEIPIEYLAEDTVLADRGLMLLEDGTDTTVDVTLEGTRWNLAKVDRDDILIQADLSNVTATGQQNISNTTGFTTRGLAQIVKFTEIKPFTSTVNIGELYSKTVDVRYEIIGNVAEGYSAGELQLSNTSVEIRGQEEMLDQVSYAKVSLDIGPDAVSTVSQLLPFQYYDENDQPLSSSGIHSSVDQVQVTLPVNVTKELALTMDFHEVPGARLSNVNVDINPKSITVSGDAEQLRDVDSLVLSEFDLINLDSSTIYNYVIPVPEGCENLSGITQATLRLSFKDMTTAEVTTDRIRYENLAMDGQACGAADAGNECADLRHFRRCIQNHRRQHYGSGRSDGFQQCGGKLHRARQGVDRLRRRHRNRRDLSGAGGYQRIPGGTHGGAGGGIAAAE